MLTVDREGGDAITGKAGGLNWTDEELRSNAFAALCPQGWTVTDLVIKRNKRGGVAKFTGRCVE